MDGGLRNPSIFKKNFCRYRILQNSSLLSFRCLVLLRVPFLYDGDYLNEVSFRCVFLVSLFHTATDYLQPSSTYSVLGRKYGCFCSFCVFCCRPCLHVEKNAVRSSSNFISLFLMLLLLFFWRKVGGVFNWALNRPMSKTICPIVTISSKLLSGSCRSHSGSCFTSRGFFYMRRRWLLQLAMHFRTAPKRNQLLLLSYHLPDADGFVLHGIYPSASFGREPAGIVPQFPETWRKLSWQTDQSLLGATQSTNGKGSKGGWFLTQGEPGTLITTRVRAWERERVALNHLVHCFVMIIPATNCLHNEWESKAEDWILPVGTDMKHFLRTICS